MKTELRTIFFDTLEAISLDRVLREKVRCSDGVLTVGDERLRLADFKKILVVAIGKAARPMAAALADIAAPARVSGIIVGPTASADLPPYFLEYVGGHPYPNEQSLHAAAVIEEMLTGLRPHHLVFFLLSGGGSALCEKPIDPSMSLADVRGLYEALVTCGADIVEMNVVRKHFSAVKGGRLAARAHPARQVTLYVSDVPVDQPSSIASGPTMADESTVQDCRQALERMQIRDRLPASVLRLLDDARLPETPKPGDDAFADASWHSLLDNSHAVAAVRERAERAGWLVETDLSVDDQPIAAAADRLLERLRALRAAHPGKRVAVLTGGELSSPVTGAGRGGRNQAFVLDCVPKIAGDRIAVLSAGTDGVDGNSPAAGAVADGETAGRAHDLGMDPAKYFLDSDAYGFFSALSDTLQTGPTGNNVRDVRLLVAY